MNKQKLLIAALIASPVLTYASTDFVAVIKDNGKNLYGFDKPDITEPTVPEQLVPTTQIKKLTASDGSSGDFFGVNGDVDGNIVVIGSVSANAAYVYEYNGSDWIETDILKGVVSGSYTGFGHSVAIENNTIVIGAKYEKLSGEERGAIYIFEKNGGSWTSQRIPSPDQYGIGWQVDIDNGVIIASHNDDYEGYYMTETNVHVFEKSGNTWARTTTIPHPADTSSKSIGFGHDIAISGNKIVVGGPVTPSGAKTAGFAYVYEYDGANATLIKTLTPSNGQASDAFGHSVDIDGDNVIVGTYAQYDNRNNAYIYNYNGGSWDETILTHSGSNSNANVGTDVSIENNLAAVSGNFLNNGSGVSTGGAYVYKFEDNNWVEKGTLFSNDGAKYDQGGSFIDIENSYITYGAKYDDDKGNSSGSAYIFAP